MKVISSIVVIALLLISFPNISIAQTSQATPTDLEVVSIEFNPANGHPSAIVVKNIGTTDYIGEIRSGVTLLGGSDRGLYQSVGSLDYGREYYPDAFVNGRVPEARVTPGQQYRVILSDIPGYRHRHAVRAEASIRPTDSNATNNKKIVTIPMPDFTTRISSVTKDDTSDRNNYDRYTLKYDIVNAGTVGYIGASSMSEPRHEININYQNGSKDVFGNNISYRTFESIPVGGSIAKEKSIYVNKSETPKEIVINVDTENYLAESNEGNNTITQSFTGDSATPPPTNSTEVTANTEPLIIAELSEVDDGIDIHPVIKNDNTIVGIAVKPCTALSGIKDTKDNISSALTFNKSKKAEKKLKQVASRAKSISDSDGTLIDDPKCLAKQLAKYEDSQNDAVKIIEKLDKKDHDTAEDLSLLAIQSGITQAKTINWQLANSDSTDEIKKQIHDAEKNITAGASEIMKLVTDSEELKDTLNTSFDDNGSALSAILNLDLIQLFDGIEAITKELDEISLENIGEIQAVLADEGLAESLGLESFLDDIYQGEGSDNDSDFQIDDFVQTFDEDSAETPDNNSDDADTNDSSSDTNETNDSNTQEPENENIVPTQDDVQPSNDDTEPSGETSAGNGDSENSEQE